MMSKTSALLLVLPLVLVFLLQSVSLEEQWKIDARDAVRYVKDYDLCNVRWFRTYSVSETKRKANNDCQSAFDSFITLPEKERLSCINPHAPRCYWFAHRDKGFFQACAFRCDRQADPPGEYWSMDQISLPCRRSTRKVPLEEIVLTLSSADDHPIRFSHPAITKPSSPKSRPTTPPSYSGSPSVTSTKPTPKWMKLKPTLSKSNSEDINFKAGLYIQHRHELMEARNQNNIGHGQ